MHEFLPITIKLRFNGRKLISMVKFYFGLMFEVWYNKEETSMKKLLIIIILIGAAYLIYDNFIKEEKILEVTGNLVKMNEGVNIDAPAIQPRAWGHIEGKVKNVSDKDVENIEIVYKINGKESIAKVAKLAAGKESNFKTDKIMLNSYESTHFLERVTFSNK